MSGGARWRRTWWERECLAGERLREEMVGDYLGFRGSSKHTSLLRFITLRFTNRIVQALD